MPAYPENVRSRIAHWEAGIAHWESVHARKWITSTVADRTSSLPDVSGMHGFAACRPWHERIREPRIRVRQVLHDESRSCGDWSNEISQRQVSRKSVAQPKRTLPSGAPGLPNLTQLRHWRGVSVPRFPFRTTAALRSPRLPCGGS
jgi:hypothetical protein